MAANTLPRIERPIKEFTHFASTGANSDHASAYQTAADKPKIGRWRKLILSFVSWPIKPETANPARQTIRNRVMIAIQAFQTGMLNQGSISLVIIFPIIELSWAYRDRSSPTMIALKIEDNQEMAEIEHLNLNSEIRLQS